MSWRSCFYFLRAAHKTLYTLQEQLGLLGRSGIRPSSTMAQTVTPILSVLPTRGLVDEKFKVALENLPPRFPVTLHSLHQSEDKDYWEAFGYYVSDDRGRVTVSEDASLGGTYKGVEPMGLLWSMHPVPGSRTGLRLRKMDVQSPMVVLISAYKGHAFEGFREQPPLASALTERWYMAPGVQRIDIREGGVIGTIFIPPGPGPFPGVLDMWGGGGGLVEYRSALLASHGFVSLALDYLSPKVAVADDQSLVYFEKAFNIIQQHPQVIKDRVGICGLCLGASVTLNVAAYSESVSPRCCVCISGSHVLPAAKSLSYVINDGYKHMDKLLVDEQNRMVWRHAILPITTNPDEKLDMGRIKCPLLLVNGDDDQSKATVESAEDIAKMMRAAGNEHLLTTLNYHDAGHLIEPPYTPHFRASNFIIQHLQQKVLVLWGGKTKPHADAQEDSWQKILSFLREHLYPCPSSSIPQAKL
ncbi:peroxisomal succinyl-coenzyme A thioesterase-like isoform X3 [Myripristis murdjan]|uniref:Peroxisomal succinyl-coenzyme A thioesterase-like n=1 Tax=Myripristis murdjan TaxID=586833 RepID=A0A667ZSV9_9TELE|nr:peroxisomal succinyl-coenzyme A thioesterase-like isoform X3 [Myripristis murdjan]